jgi:hypothetical protein
MSKTLKQKVDTAIKLLKTAEQQAATKESKMVEVNTPAWNTDGWGQKTLIDNNLVEISYSGGKDSDVILRLAQMADIKHMAIHKRTTIDEAGTLRHCIENKAVILEPQKSFFSLIEQSGFRQDAHDFAVLILKNTRCLTRQFTAFVFQNRKREQSCTKSRRFVECTEVTRKTRSRCFFRFLIGLTMMSKSL